MIKDISERELDYICGRLGIERTADVKMHLHTMLEATRIYIERDKVRQGLWKEAGAEDSAHHAKSKALRGSSHARLIREAPDVDRRTTLFEEALDDGLDLINYGVFHVNNLMAGRFGE